MTSVNVVERDAALDAVKGLLVLLMILYHWLNYFVTSDGEVYKYIRFITPSFIFITGFIITSIYLRRYHVGDGRVTTKLLVRGAKLLGLFTVLNVMGNLLLRRNYNGGELGLSHFVAIAPAVYLKGDGIGAAFEVLVPISYLLVVSSLMWWGCGLRRPFLVGLWCALVGGVYALQAVGMGSGNLELLSMGLLGMVVGSVWSDGMERVIRPDAYWVAAYLTYLIGLNLLNVVYAVQVAGLMLNLGVLYMVARRLGNRQPMARSIVLLGQYSLFAYVGHIVILQLLVRAARPTAFAVAAVVGALALAVLLTVISVEATHYLRGRWVMLDRLYRVVFA
jgi:peptidoglycan/LPS O-acetylase OafA/YrhL